MAGLGLDLRLCASEASVQRASHQPSGLLVFFCLTTVCARYLTFDSQQAMVGGGPEGHFGHNPKSGVFRKPRLCIPGAASGEPWGLGPWDTVPFAPCWSCSSQWGGCPAGSRIEHLGTQVGEQKELQDHSECLGKRLALRRIWGGVLVLPPANRTTPGRGGGVGIKRRKCQEDPGAHQTETLTVIHVLL